MQPTSGSRGEMGAPVGSATYSHRSAGVGWLLGLLVSSMESPSAGATALLRRVENGGSLGLAREGPAPAPAASPAPAPGFRELAALPPVSPSTCARLLSQVGALRCEIYSY